MVSLKLEERQELGGAGDGVVSLPCQGALSQRLGTRRAIDLKPSRDLLVPLLVRIFLLSLSPERQMQ